MLKVEFVPKRLIRTGCIVGLATSLAAICLYENTGNLRQEKADSRITGEFAVDEGYGVTRIDLASTAPKMPSKNPGEKARWSPCSPSQRDIAHGADAFGVAIPQEAAANAGD